MPPDIKNNLSYMSNGKGKKHKIILTGGGTGGHIFPLIAIVREVKRILPVETLDIHYLGPKDGIPRKYIEREGIKVKYISAGKIRRYSGIQPFLQNLIDMFIKTPIGVVQSFIFLFSFSPDMILSKGGYGSFPVILSGRMLQIPSFMHESDSVVGAANKFLQRFIAEIFVAFPNTEGVDKAKMLVVGNPIREELIKGNKEKARSIFNLKGEKPVLLILGGSQGSERINDLLLSSIRMALEDFEIIHQCGGKNHEQIAAEVNAVITRKDLKERYHAYPFLEEEKLKHAYKCADLVVSRAGSGTIFEVAANGRAGVFLPLPESAQDHQVKNAYEYAASGAAVVMEEGNLTSHFFLEKLREIFSIREQIEEMEKNALKFAKPRAGYIVAAYIKEYLTR